MVSNSFKGSLSLSSLASLIFRGAIWHIWKEQNNRLYEGSEKHKIQLFSKIEDSISVRLRGAQFAEVPSALKKKTLENWNLHSNLIPNIDRIVQWTRPTAEWFKLNSDGALSTAYVGFGDLLHNSSTKVLLTFHERCDHDLIFSIELKDVLVGLQYTKSLMGTNLCIWVEVDSKTAVDIPQDRSKPPP